MAALELKRQLGVTYKTAWRMAHAIRKLMEDDTDPDKLNGVIEGDETYVGVVLELTGPACSHCGERKTRSASLWGIESDAGDYFAEVLIGLSSEAHAELEKELHV